MVRADSHTAQRTSQEHIVLKLREQYRGVMIGVLAGDALGAPYEKKEPEFIREDFIRRGGLTTFDYEDPWKKYGTFPAGLPTDDSELTAALAESLIEHRACVPSDQYIRFKRAGGGKSFLWDGFTLGFGPTTRLMLKPETYEQSQERAHLFLKPTNGSLMRSAPLALMYHGRIRELITATHLSSAVTHGHEVAIQCCTLFVMALEMLLSNSGPEAAWRSVRASPHTEPEVLEITKRPILVEPRSSNAWPPAGSAVHTLHIALWCMLHAKDYREGIEMAVLKGGDTDTAAAVTGALLGARFGIDGIPQEWRDVLIGGDRMIELADSLYTINDAIN